jgi:hypothetical protein
MERDQSLFDETRLARVLREEKETPWTLCNLEINVTAR